MSVIPQHVYSTANSPSHIFVTLPSMAHITKFEFPPHKVSIFNIHRIINYVTPLPVVDSLNLSVCWFPIWPAANPMCPICGTTRKIQSTQYVPCSAYIFQVWTIPSECLSWSPWQSINKQGDWSSFDVHESGPYEFWTEPLVSWGDPIYPEETNEDDAPSPMDKEEETGSEFVPSESISE